jgi:hypothetical protein
MSSSAIVVLQTSLVSLGVTVLIGLSPLSVRAESGQLQSAQPIAAAGQHKDADAATGPSTVLKTPSTASGPATSSAAIQPIPSTSPQLPVTSAADPLSSQAATGLTAVAAPSGGVGTAATKIGTIAAASVSSPGASTASAVQSQIDSLELLSPAQRRTYQRAASLFTGFCHDWERLLHERELNNLEHLSWREDGGLEVATYTGYGKVEACECKASKEGLPIGKLRYEEIIYSIAGKTIDEAQHAAPKLTHEVNTLEIFSWDQGKWFY